MRLHSLSVTAFGPFAGTVTVDFDTLSSSGLFLVRGATGAGKTSLLDAVAFALYADVPGARSKKGLHSDHADRGTVPGVMLEFTAGGRRLRIERSPEFSRPKSRGSGLTKVPAKAVLFEHRDGAWQPLSTRHDEIGEVVRDVVGLGLEQFSKVVLLPQGDFAAFLRATPEERRGLLERLFDVTAFAGVEEWFAVRRKESADLVESHRTALRGDLGILTEVLAHVPAGVVDSSSIPTASCEAPDFAALSPDHLGATVSRLQDRLSAAVTASMAELDVARLADGHATAAHLAALDQLNRRHRGEEALRSLALLEGRQDAHTATLALVAAADRAASVQGDLKALQRAHAAVDAAASRLRSLGAELEHGGLTVPAGSVLEVSALQRRLDEGTVALTEAKHVANAMSRRQAQQAALLLDTEAASDGSSLVAAKLDGAKSALEQARQRLEEISASAAQLEQGTAEVTLLERLVTVRAAYERDIARAEVLREARLTRREAAQGLRQVYQDLRQARLDGMAAELATALRDGGPCPVCGSYEHPAPAQAARALTAADVETAEQHWQQAVTALHRTEREAVALQATQAERLDELGSEERDHATLERLLDRSRQRVAALTKAARLLPQADAAVTAARASVSSVEEEQRALRDKLTTLMSTSAAILQELSVDGEGLRELLDRHAEQCPCAGAGADTHTEPAADPEGADPGGPGEVRSGLAAEGVLADTTRRHARVAGVLASYAEALVGHQRAVAEQASVEDGTTHSLSEAGFTSVAEARQATLPVGTVADLRAKATAYERAVMVAQTTLGDPEVEFALAQPVPDVDELSRLRETARTSYTAAVSSDTLLREALTAMERVGQSITERSSRLATAYAEHDALRRVADTLAGTSPDNALRMRLSAFVLAARLEKVAALANERLRTLGEGRYQLRHTDGLAARGARSGLGLEVLDLWTGQPRDTSSLSGGESFMASLALALGLADAVREEAGGFDLQTLFVDEGFGTLDDDSLEHVMNVLDELREGGRAVGVVSHVAELRSRIPNQVVVTKTERGSSVRVTCSDETAPAA